MRTMLKTATLTLALPAMLAAGLPAVAATAAHQSVARSAAAAAPVLADSWQKHGDRYRSYDNRYYGQNAYAEPVYQDTRVWRGDDGRYYCKKKNGTTGMIIGGAGGALLGREIAGRGDRTLGTILGAAGGALLGRSIERNSSSSRCR